MTGITSLTVPRSPRSIVELLGTELSLPKARSIIERARRISRLPPGTRREVWHVGGIRCEWLIPEQADSSWVLVYLHGGGFVLGRTALHVGLAATLGHLCAARVLLLDYRLAPEHPFPAALDDVTLVYRALLAAGWGPHRITIAGDSAGGNLTLATLLRLRDAGSPLPAAAACLSPVVDLADSAERSRKGRDRWLRPEVVTLFHEAYVRGQDPRHPLISPVYGDLRGLPPLVIHAGGEELLRDDAERLATAARAAGVQVELAIYPGMWHVWQLSLERPEAQESLRRIARFLRQHVWAAV